VRRFQMLTDFGIEFLSRTYSAVVPSFDDTLALQGRQMDFQLIP
jgi:hypothetical protein